MPHPVSSNVADSVCVLRVDSSARGQGSTSRRLGDLLINRLSQAHEQVSIVDRDAAAGLPFVNAEWVSSNFTDPSERTQQQRATLALSDELVTELKQADIVVIGAPIYNFGVPASLKAWIDLVARARETFRYTEEGPVGLLEGKKAYILAASGGTEVGSEIDFATNYLRHVLGFLGVHDVEVIAADRGMARGEAAFNSAAEKIRRVGRPELSLDLDAGVAV